ncbi:hypothetical protein PBV87_07365 [Niameybacter massiliensis]|uniref:Uncharacterized protein n=1 Tax=Holtiella tumoricola TaxID=3018743 RepID=A0AA42J0B1_9FIRM|nr:hypothetical protein [Holtiella tumoricola]MDA3731297.1 hypothetical protein [Holtiella tumoricola]
MKDLIVGSARYWLPHKTLPRYIFNNTDLFLRMVRIGSDKQICTMIKSLWETCQMETGYCESPYIPQVVKREYRDFSVLVLTMPTPKVGLEVFYVGITYNNENEVRYFVLENSMTKPDDAIANLCEWTKECHHINYRFTNNIELEHFIDFIAEEFRNRNHEPGAISSFSRENKRW